MTNDLSKSVIIPVDDFSELQSMAFLNTHTPTLGDRAASTAQFTLFLAGVSAAVVGGTWGWAKVVDKLEERRHQRSMTQLRAVKTPK